jgi:hypothetical protein
MFGDARHCTFASNWSVSGRTPRSHTNFSHHSLNTPSSLYYDSDNQEDGRFIGLNSGICRAKRPGSGPPMAELKVISFWTVLLYTCSSESTHLFLTLSLRHKASHTHTKYLQRGSCSPWVISEVATSSAFRSTPCASFFTRFCFLIQNPNPNVKRMQVTLQAAVPIRVGA